MKQKKEQSKSKYDPAVWNKRLAEFMGWKIKGYGLCCGRSSIEYWILKGGNPKTSLDNWRPNQDLRHLFEVVDEIISKKNLLEFNLESGGCGNWLAYFSEDSPKDFPHVVAETEEGQYGNILTAIYTACCTAIEKLQSE